MDLWFYVEVTPICHCNFFLFFYKNYYRSVKLDGRGTGHLWRMWVPMLITLKGNKELISFQKVNNVPLILRSPWLREARVCVRCIYVKARVTVVVCVGFTHIFLCFLTSPPPLYSPHLYSLSFICPTLFLWLRPLHIATVHVCAWAAAVCVNKLQPIFWSKANDVKEKWILFSKFHFDFHF